MEKVRLRAVPAPAIPDRNLRMTALELLCREKVSELIQAVLVAEVDEFLGRIANVPGKSASGYRDGYEEARTVAYGSTPVTIRRPRVRESEIPFSSQILPPFKRRFPELDKAMHELWLPRALDPGLRALSARAARRNDAALALDGLAGQQTVPRGLSRLAATSDHRRVRVPLGGRRVPRCRRRR
jgi:hypothetical protein